MASKRLQPKERWLRATQQEQAPGGHSESARWAEQTDSPLFQAAVERAYAEYVKRIVPEPAMPGVAAFKALGAKEVLEVLMNLGEPDAPFVKGAEKKLLTT